MVSSSSPPIHSSSSSSPSSFLHKQNDINVLGKEQDIQKMESTPTATEDGDRTITAQHHDEKPGFIEPHPQQNALSPTVSNEVNQPLCTAIETTQPKFDTMIPISPVNTDTTTQPEPVDSSSTNSLTHTSHEIALGSTIQHASEVSTKENVASKTATSLAAGIVVETGQVNNKVHLELEPSDNETALHPDGSDGSASSSLQPPPPPPPSSSSSSTSKNQHISSSQPTTNDASVIRQDQTTDKNRNRVSQYQPPSLDHEYLVKSIDWLDPNTNTSRVVRIITQNENGPCPLVSICNVLFIRGDLNMQPFERTTVTFEYLLGILGDYLLNHAPSDIKAPESPSAQHPPASPTNQRQEPRKSSLTRQATMEHVLTYRHNLDTALSILPRLQTGLDVNVQFSSIHDFEPTEELALFDLFDVDLVHGWIIDPQDEEGYRVVNRCKSYNGIVECIVRGAESDLDTNDNNDEKEDVDETKIATRESNIHDGLVASQFLENSATQLTYYGIELLTDTLPKNKLCVLFRNNHFSTLYKHPISDRLYTLVTDSGLVSEENIVWETLGDVDQGTSEFVNSQFVQPPPARIRPTSGSSQNQDRETADLDYAIALSLQQHQHEEIARTSETANSDGSTLTPTHRIRNSDNISPRDPPHSIVSQPHSPNPSKKKNCIIS
ncbi:hypothetical protein BCR42DRAFT_427072 [Absidia repens]|uniref:MINDY deubiquitinase domain-containing protein n=1 Tax=Absidia repens TaxID=90262 RepID=A0A1X2I0I8_9FUNG|nr:hypothetical protein BCR42DRAFT_427072 [Absidia repens]